MFQRSLRARDLFVLRHSLPCACFPAQLLPLLLLLLLCFI
jgi:hypothetical protein